MNRPNRGFTIMELLIVLVIAAAAFSLILPNFSNTLANAELKGAAREVASALRHARNQAIARGREATFWLDVGYHYYRVDDRAKNFSLPNKIDLTLFTAESEITGEGRGAIRFFPDGSSTGGRVTLEIGQKKRLVDVNWLTGQVTVRAEAVTADG